MNDPVPAEGGPDSPAAAGVPDLPAPPALTGSATWRFSATLARFALSFAAVPILTRVLGMSQWGLLAILQSATAPLFLLELGIGAATVKLVSEAIARGDRTGAVRIVHTTAWFNGVVGVAGALAFCAAAPWLAGSAFAIPPEQRALALAGFRVAALNWLAVFFGTTFLSALSAMQRFDRIAKLTTLTTVAATAGGVLAAVAGGDVVTVLGVQTAAVVAGTALYGRAALAALPGLGVRPRWDGASFRRSATFGAWAFVSTLGTLLAGWSDRYVLAVVLPPVMVGFYAVAHALAWQVYAAFNELGEVLFPAVSHRHSQGDSTGARRLALVAGWAMGVAFGVAATVVGAIGGHFIALWVSPAAAEQGTPVLRFLCVGTAIAIASVAPLYHFLGTGRARAHATATLLGGTASVATTIALVPRYGLPGAGVGMVVGALVRTAFVARTWRAPETPLSQMTAHLFVPPLVSVGSLVLLAMAHDGLEHSSSWPMLALEAAVAVAAAAVVQLVVSELLPGGSRRRREVVESFRPVLARLMGRPTPGSRA